MGGNRIRNSHTCSILRHEQMAAELRLQNQPELVDLCIGWHAGSGNSFSDGELAELEGGDKEPRGGIEV